jgi:hypothetical protein
LLPDSLQADTVSAEIDSLPARAPATRTRTARAASDTLAGGMSRDAPWRVMLRSFLLPGWGQLYNRQWLKAGIVIAGEGTLIGIYGVYSYRAAHARDVNERENDINVRQGALWYGAGVVLLSMIDAYVDAHLYRFKEQFRPVEVRVMPQGVAVAVGF